MLANAVIFQEYEGQGFRRRVCGSRALRDRSFAGRQCRSPQIHSQASVSLLARPHPLPLLLPARLLLPQFLLLFLLFLLNPRPPGAEWLVGTREAFRISVEVLVHLTEDSVGWARHFRARHGACQSHRWLWLPSTSRLHQPVSMVCNRCPT